MGVDPRHGAMAVADSLQVGQRLQFQLRDGATSRQELDGLLADAQQSCQQQPPIAALLLPVWGGAKGSMGKPTWIRASAASTFQSCPSAACSAMVKSARWMAAPSCTATPHAGPLWFHPS